MKRIALILFIGLVSCESKTCKCFNEGVEHYLRGDNSPVPQDCLDDQSNFTEEEYQERIKNCSGYKKL